MKHALLKTIVGLHEAIDFCAHICSQTNSLICGVQTNFKVLYMRKRASFSVLLILLVLPILSSILLTDTSALEEPASVPYIAAYTLDFTRGPVVGMVTNSSAVIFWRTSDLTNASVHYGLNTSLLERESNSTFDTDHYITLDNLEFGAKYWYQVESNVTSSEIYHFKTAPADGDEFKLVIIGDNRPGAWRAPRMPWVFSRIAEMILDQDPHLVVLTGDYVYRVLTNHSFNLVAWDAFTDIIDQLGHYMPLYGAVGNHDTGADSGIFDLQYYFDAFVQFDEPSPYFSFDYAGVHFTILDTSEEGSDNRIIGQQYDWMVDDLTDTNSAMKFVFGHAPLYPISHVRSALDYVPAERDRLQQLFEDTNVTLYAAGHDHAYNRIVVNGVTHIITGGAGAYLYDSPWGGDFHHLTSVFASSKYVYISAVDLDGEVQDFYKITNDDPIKIYHRTYPNASRRGAGILPEIYFSKVPVEKYYSWDSGPNSTLLTGIPAAPGDHTLDVYALDTNDVWTHVRYVFTTMNPSWSTTPSPSVPSYPINLILMTALIGIAAITSVIIVVVIKKRQSR
jgi:Icc-related predicted phosphoesterase